MQAKAVALIETSYGRSCRGPDNLVMHRLGFEFEQEILILRVVFSLRDLVTGELTNCQFVTPESHGDEMSLLIYRPLQDVYGLVPGDRPVIRDSPRVEECAIAIGILRSYPRMPYPYDHSILPKDPLRGTFLPRRREECMMNSIPHGRNRALP